MRNYIGYIIDYSDGNLTDRKRRWFESELVYNEVLNEEFKLFNQVNSSMRGKFDLAEVQNDPEFKEVDTLTKHMVYEYHRNSEKFEYTKTFIKNSLTQNKVDKELQEEINLTSKEIKTHNINDVTKNWVDEWNSSNQNENAESLNRRSFITQSLNNDGSQQNNAVPVRYKKNRSIHIIGLAAAALIAVLLVLRTLSPSNNPEDIYQEFYKPLNAFSSTIRNSANTVDPFSIAVEKYKQGQYQVAGVMFSDLIYEDPSNISYRFFSGLSQLELKSYEQSIQLFQEVISNKGEFRKEAKWYLVMAYIKTHDLQKASVILKELSQEKGYYQKMSQDLLDRIK